MRVWESWVAWRKEGCPLELCSFHPILGDAQNSTEYCLRKPGYADSALLCAGVGRDKSSDSGHSVILWHTQQSSPIYLTNPLLCHSPRMHKHDFKYILSFQEEFMEQYKLKTYRLQYYKKFTCLQSFIISVWSFLSLLYSSSILCRSASICSCIAKFIRELEQKIMNILS